MGSSLDGPLRATVRGMASKPTGFRNVAKSIARKQGISQERASAILAASSRNASAAAKRKNPKLSKVKGG